jgi:hypothetical protein
MSWLSLSRLNFLCSVLIISTASLGQAQVAYPPKPDKYDAQVRYRIRASRDIRITQFEMMAKHLRSIGFVHTDEKAFEQTLLDPGAELLSGSLPPSSVVKLLDDENIKTVVLVPGGSKTLDDPKKLVQVRIGVATGLQATEQKTLHDQATAQLARLGFVASTAYDHQAYRVIRGTLPAGQVLELLKDLRSLPAGWVVGGTDRSSLPLPIRSVLPLRIVEVLPDLPPVVPPVVQSIDAKYSPDVKTIAADAAQAEKPVVVEAILVQETERITTELRSQLRTALPGIMVEGFIGNTATLRLPRASMLAGLAALQDVQTIRLPRAASETIVAGGDGNSGSFLKTSNTEQLHGLGYNGDGVTIAVIASEFPGLEQKPVAGTNSNQVVLDGKALPAGSSLLDLTGEVNPLLQPLPATGGLGGSATALAVNQAAPKAAIVLLRVDPTRFHQLLTVARAASGDSAISTALTTRSEELGIRGEILGSRRKTVAGELTRAFSDLSDEPKPKKRREDAAAGMKQLQQEETDYKNQLDRFLGIKNGLESLRTVGVVVNTLVWEAGYPLDAQSELSRYLEAKYAPGAVTSAIRASKKPAVPVWIQAAGGSAGSVWSGPFLDTDKNGIMEFAGNDAKLAANRWTKELAFLGYRELDGKTGTLSEGQKLRLTLQWREPHNRDLILAEEPTYTMNLRLFQQLDPTGKMTASDELFEIARTSGNANRLYKSLGSGVYETTLDVTLPATGVYAVRVEGGASQSDIPQTARLAAEIRPRLFVQLLDAKQAAKGVALFADDAIQNSGVGIPGDSPAAVAIGASGLDPTCTVSLTGVGPGVALGAKPNLLSAGSVKFAGKEQSGSGIAAGYAGGLAASLLSAGVRPADMARSVGLKPGAPLVIPTEWLQVLSPKVLKDNAER